MVDRWFQFSDQDAQVIRTRLQKRFSDRTAHGCQVRPGGGQAYPRFLWNGRSYSAHRVSYAVWKGPVPLRWYVCHLCSNTQCVNPTHLRLGTAQQNSADHQRKTKDKTRPDGFRGPFPEDIQSPEGLDGPPPYVPSSVEPITPLLAMAFPDAFPETKTPTPVAPPNWELERLAFPASFKDEE